MDFRQSKDRMIIEKLVSYSELLNNKIAEVISIKIG